MPILYRDRPSCFTGSYADDRVSSYAFYNGSLLKWFRTSTARQKNKSHCTCQPKPYLVQNRVLEQNLNIYENQESKNCTDFMRNSYLIFRILADNCRDL